MKCFAKTLNYRLNFNLYEVVRSSIQIFHLGGEVHSNKSISIKRGDKLKLFRQLCIILVICLAGEAINKFFNLPIPGSVIGMIVLLALLSKGIIKLEMIDGIAKFLLDHLALFFVPPGISLINNLDLLRKEWFPILAIILISTIIVIIVTGLTIQLLKRRRSL